MISYKQYIPIDFQLESTSNALYLHPSTHSVPHS